MTRRADWLPRPAGHLLHAAAHAVNEAYGHPCYLVGSALEDRNYRDIDVRIIMPNEEWHKWFGKLPYVENPRWMFFCMATSLYFRKATGLDVDFQVQREGWVQETDKKKRRVLLGRRMNGEA